MLFLKMLESFLKVSIGVGIEWKKLCFFLQSFLSDLPARVWYKFAHPF